MSKIPLNGAKGRTETVSFRINTSVRAVLEEESKRTGVNLNTLVSQIFSGYANWGRYVKQLKFLPTSKDVLREVFQVIDREKLEEIGRRLGETAAHEEILFLFQEINRETVLRFIKLWSSHFDASDYRYDKGRHFFTLHHDVNAKYSLFLKAYIHSTLHGTLNQAPRFERISPNSITFSYED